MKIVKHFYFFIILFLINSSLSYSQVTSAGSGNWGDGSTWVGGVIPGTGDNVIIVDEHKVVLNTDATVNNLTIDGTLEYEDVTARTLTVNGNITADSLKTASLPGAGPLIHTLVLNGDLTVQSYFDLRSGSNPNVGAADIIITGSSNSTLTGPSGMDVNGVTINKSGGAKIILGSDFIQNNNSSNPPLGILNLTNGIIETGSFEWRVRATGSAAGVQGGSDTSYVNGNLVLYMPSGTPIRTYPLGDGESYRPLTVYLGSSVSNSGVKGYIVHGDANTGSSTFSGSIDKVSKIRYYVLQNISNNNLLYYSYAPSYGLDDFVSPGNTDLRVATSDDARAIWMDRGTYGTHTTDLTNPPTFIQSDSTAQRDSLSSQEIFYIALARVTGTTTNSLPVELVSFSANVKNNDVMLNWSTSSEINNRGFEIERSLDNKNFSVVGFVLGSGTTTEQKFYSFSDNVSLNGNYFYRLKQVDVNGTFKYSSSVNVEIKTSFDYSLSQNYPNPFNPSTVIEFSLPQQANVQIKIFDSIGRLVNELLNEKRSAGINSVRWTGKDHFGNDLSSGLYFYRIETLFGVLNGKMLLIR